ncbi:hypothetical protein HFP72_03020 [Nocardiopsis sp. ARC36]
MSLVPALLIWFIFNLAVFPGIDVRRGGVVVKRFMGEVEIPFDLISGIEWRGGIKVRLNDRRVVNCVAFPASAYSLMLGYGNFRKIALEVERAMSNFDSSESSGGLTEREYWNFRTLASVFVLYCSLFFGAYLILL